MSFIHGLAAFLVSFVVVWAIKFATGLSDWFAIPLMILMIAVYWRYRSANAIDDDIEVIDEERTPPASPP